MKGKDIIVVSSSGVQAYYPIGQKLSINGRTCVVAKSGDCVNCAFVYLTFRSATKKLHVRT